MTNQINTLLIIGGFYNLIFAVIHLTLPKVCKWKEDIAKLTLVNRGMFQVFSILVTLYLFFLAYVSLFHTQELIDTSLGHMIIAFIALGWTIRAVSQIFIYGVKELASIALTIVFFAGTIIYLIPMIQILTK